MSSKQKQCNTLWIALGLVAAGVVIYMLMRPQSSSGSFLVTQRVANEHQLIAHTTCAQLGKQTPAALPLCHQLFPFGRYPLPKGIRDQPKLIPKNFSDQYEAHDPVTVYPQNWNQRSASWTLNLQDADDGGFSSPAPYQSHNRTPTWMETWYRPGALENSRTYLNDNLRVRPRV